MNEMQNKRIKNIQLEKIQFIKNNQNQKKKNKYIKIGCAFKTKISKTAEK